MKSTHRVEHSTITATMPKPVPMPGRLAVEHYDNLLKTRVTTALDQEKSDTPITATGTLTRVRFLDPRGGRAMAVLTDDDGNTATVTFAPEIVDQIRPLLAEGTRVTVGGLVGGPNGSQPAGITGYNARMAD